jgi:hypothetical protein
VVQSLGRRFAKLAAGNRAQVKGCRRRRRRGCAAKPTHNWCQRCELFALHDKSTQNVDGSADIDAMATAQDRWDRWELCQKYEIDYFGETPPEANLNLSPSCTPCGSGEFADTNNGGACTSCPTGEVPRGDHCEKRLPGVSPGAEQRVRCLWRWSDQRWQCLRGLRVRSGRRSRHQHLHGLHARRLAGLAHPR